MKVLDRARYQRERAARDARDAELSLRNYRETLRTAERNGQQWTGPELEIATRSDISVKDAAEMLGRTFYAVQRMRVLCKADPRKTALLGRAKDGAP